MILQERDRKILKLCYEQQFLLVEAVEEFFFAGSSKEKARERIVELERSGYLTASVDAVLGRRKISRLTARGEAVARSESAFDISVVRRLNAPTLIHDATVTQVRLRLEQIWPRARFVPERAIKKQEFPQTPDGIFYFESGNGIAIEIENSGKGKRRFVSLLHRWKNVPSIVFVLFVATRADLERSISLYLQSGPPEQPMGVVPWESLRSGTPSVATSRGPLDLFSKEVY